MGKTLRSAPSIIIIFLFFIINSGRVFARTVLSRGDIVVGSVDADPPNHFDFVPLIDLRPDAIIHFTNDTHAYGASNTTFPPRASSMVIRDDGTPPVVINEFLADPPPGPSGDSNGDGTTDANDDEFIEIVNSTSVDIDISGWKLSDDGGTTIRHVFPSGTVLPGNGAAVVFGGGNPAGNFGGSIVQTASKGSLSLADSKGRLTLLDDRNNIIQDVDYGSEAGEGQSLSRDPDVTGSAFVKHSTAENSNGALFSPGTKINGNAFGSTYAVGIRGVSGWRYIASPTSNTTFKDLFAGIWTQGIAGSDEPGTSASLANIYSYSEREGGTYTAVGSMSDQLEAGRGYLIYVYKDDDFNKPGVQGGFPKVIRTSKAENKSATITISATDEDTDGINNSEGFNLIGNPFGTDISFQALRKVLSTRSDSLNNNFYIWDSNAGSGNGSYIAKSRGTIAPFQAFFVRDMKAGSSRNVTINRDEVAANTGSQFYQKAGDEGLRAHVSFKIHLGDGQKHDTYEVKFEHGGKIGEDLYDAYKLYSLNTNAINLYSTVGDEVELAKNVLPPLKSLKNKLHIPLRYTVPQSGDYTYTWDALKAIPQNVAVSLLDRKTDRKIDMKLEHSYTFTIHQQDGEHDRKQRALPANMKRRRPLLTAGNGAGNTEKEAEESRFDILVEPSIASKKKKDSLKQDVILSANYPNPFNSQTTLKLHVKETMHVTTTIYNIVGQKVATIYDGMVEKEHSKPMTWNVPSNMPSGVYICRVQAGNEIITRKMTLIK